MRKRSATRYGLVVGMVLLTMATIVGCGGIGSKAITLESVPNQERAALDADDIVRIMKRAGFSDEQIVEHGTKLRNTLAISGAAQVRIGEYVEAILAVSGQYIHVTTRLRGSFIYDLEAGAFL